MSVTISDRLSQLAKLLVLAVILKVALGVVFKYGDYLPAQFESGFLQGRQGYFWTTAYNLAFYLHIVSGPCSLIVGIGLMSDRLRLTKPLWHRYLGFIQILNVLIVLVPSGIWMSIYAETGATAGFGFALLGVATGVCAWMGWKSAIRKRFDEHRRWMSRCFVLLSSAVVLRIMGGVFSIIGIGYPTTYTLAAWTSWTVPLALYEIFRSRNREHVGAVHLHI
jgi:hypothetical protein